MSDQVSAEDAAAELLKRRKAREKLADYIEYVSDKEAAKHMRFLCDRLEMAANRLLPRVLVCMPPGHAKSWCTSHHFPAFYLSKFPDHNLIFATHTDSFAETWGRKVRNLMLSDEHRRLFPGIEVSDDSRAAGRWDTNKGGSYFAVGVGSAVTGKRADCIIIDDPLRGIEDANSQNIRDKLWEWYGADLYTRLKPGGIIILIQTRWHLDDLAGRLLASSKSKEGEKWYELILPALAKDKDPLGRKFGEALWAEWMDIAALEKIRAQPSMTARFWSSLYMQDPVGDGGNVVKRSWFKIWNQPTPPPLKFTLQTWDTAVTKKTTSAYSVCLTLGIFEEPDTKLPSMILLSRWRGQVEYPELREMALRLSRNYLDTNMSMPLSTEKRPDMILIEDAPVGKPLISDLTRAGINVHRFNPSKHGSKDVRLIVSTDLFENGRFWVPGQAPHYTMPRKWADEYIISMCNYPAAASRDEVDATSQAIIRVKTSGWVRNTNDDVPIEYSRVERPVQAIY